MRNSLTPSLFLPRLALATVLAASAAAAQAGRVSVGVNIGIPVVGVHHAPVGAVGLRYVNGPRVGGYRGHNGYHGYQGYPRGYHRGGHYGGGGWGWGLGLGVGLALTAPLWLGEPAPPPVIVVNAPPAPVPVVMQAPVQAAPSRPDPIIYPRNGQSAQQLEADRQECNRWATTQPAAMAEASVFYRAVEACMDGRGYTMR